MEINDKKKLTIVIATTSKDKIDGIREAFEQYYDTNNYELTIYSKKTQSEVSEQPFGNETYQGAINRINNIKREYEEALKEKGIEVDYYISCEAGIDNTNKAIINGESVDLYASEQIVCIYNPKNDTYSFGKSSSWIIPPEDIEEIKNTDLDQYLRKRGCTGLHDVGDGSYISRQQAVKEGTMSAIASARFIDRCNNYEKKTKNER